VYGVSCPHCIGSNNAGQAAAGEAAAGEAAA